MRRYERASTLLTSNRPVEDWGKLLGDTAAITAMPDRLLHHAHVLTCGPKSWRTRLQSEHRLLTVVDEHDAARAGAGRPRSSSRPYRDIPPLRPHVITRGLARSRSNAVQDSRLGRRSHWPVLPRPRLGRFSGVHRGNLYAARMGVTPPWEVEKVELRLAHGFGGTLCCDVVS
jgi:hypothetical protein